MNLKNIKKPLSSEDKRRIFAEESAILAFTEEALRRMEEIGLSKSQLAEKMAIDPAAVSKLIGGSNNFTLKTMVRIARALRARLKFSLSPVKPTLVWTTLRFNQINFESAAPLVAHSRATGVINYPQYDETVKISLSELKTRAV